MPKSEIYDVTFIGSGLIQLCLAVYFRKKGYKCLILEKRNYAGGAWSNSIKDVLPWEIAPHILPTRRSLKAFLQESNIILKPMRPKPFMEIRILNRLIKIPLEKSYIRPYSKENLILWVSRAAYSILSDFCKRLLNLDRRNVFLYFDQSSGEVVQNQLDSFLSLGGEVRFNTTAGLPSSEHGNDDLSRLSTKVCFLTANTPLYKGCARAPLSAKRVSRSLVFTGPYEYSKFGYIQFEHDETEIDCVVRNFCGQSGCAYYLVRLKPHVEMLSTAVVSRALTETYRLKSAPTFVREERYPYERQDFRSPTPSESRFVYFGGDNFSDGVLFGWRELEAALNMRSSVISLTVTQE